MFSLKKTRLGANTATTFKHVKDCCKDERGWVKHHEKLSTNKGKWNTVQLMPLEGKEMSGELSGPSHSVLHYCLPGDVTQLIALSDMQ